LTSSQAITPLPPQERHSRRVGLAVALASATLYLLQWVPVWIVGEDSALYNLLGRSLARGQGYTIYGLPHVHVPPGFPALLAGAKLAGLSSGTINALMLAAALATVYLAWRLLREHESWEWALPVLVLFACSDTTHDMSMQILSDIPCTALVLLGLWMFARWSAGRPAPLEVGVLALTAAVWMRLAVVPLVFGAGLGLLLQRRKPSWRRAWLACGLLAVLTGASLLAFYVHYRANREPGLPSYASYFTHLAQRGLGGWVAELSANLASACEALGNLLTGQTIRPNVVAAVLLLPLAGAGMWRRLRQNQAVGVIACLAFVGGLVMLRNFKARYLLPVSPLLLLYVVDGLRWALEGVEGFIRRKGNRKEGREQEEAEEPPAHAGGYKTSQFSPGAARNWAIILAIVLAMTAANLVLDVRRIYELRQSDPLVSYRKGARQPLLQVADWMARNTGPQDRFFATENISAISYLSDRPPRPLDEAVLKDPPPPERVLPLLRQQAKWIVHCGRDRPQWNELGARSVL
jgi:4-amino-4-deoxy-L-arabinose transferase-like glycosyltransferase